MFPSSSFRIGIIVLAALVAVSGSSAASNPDRDRIKPGEPYYVGHNMECVPYVRLSLPSLPGGLYSLNDKKKIINSSTPKKGRAAIVDIGQHGHIIYITGVDDSGSSRSISYVEHNNPLGTSTPWRGKVTCGKRMSDCEKRLKIVGYYKP